MTPGFFGKLPAAGDFVSRGLPPAFTTPWDRWLARHLVPRFGPAAPALFFRRAGPPAMAGVVVPSRDRAGRAFPLTVAGAAPPDRDWLDALAALATAAARGDLDVAALAAALAAHPGPPPGPARAPLRLWTSPADAVDVDPEAPGPALDALLGARAERP